MDPKWIWIIAIVCLVVFLTVISRRREVPQLEDRFRCPRCGHAFEVSPVGWAFRPKWGEKAFLKCPACGKNVWALLEKNRSFTEQKEEFIP